MAVWAPMPKARVITTIVKPTFCIVRGDRSASLVLLIQRNMHSDVGSQRSCRPPFACLPSVSRNTSVPPRIYKEPLNERISPLTLLLSAFPLGLTSGAVASTDEYNRPTDLDLANESVTWLRPYIWCPYLLVRYIFCGGFDEHFGGDQARREKARKAIRQATASIKWRAHCCKSVGTLSRC